MINLILNKNYFWYFIIKKVKKFIKNYFLYSLKKIQKLAY